MRKTQSYQNMTEGSIGKHLLLFAAPLTFSYILQQFYSTIDTLFVGKYTGSYALAAVGATGAVINLIVGFFLGISAGAGVIVANCNGAQDADGIKKATHTSILIAVWSGVFLTGIGILISGALLKLIQTPDDIFGAANLYLRIYFIGMLPMILYNVGAGVLRAMGDSMRPMNILLFCGILHVFTNYLFIVHWQMGVAGAAWSTVLSQVISAIWVLVLLARSKNADRLSFRDLKMDKPMFKRIMNISIPAGMQSSLFSIANILIQSYVNLFGSIAIAGVVAYYRIDGLLLAPMAAIGLAVTTFVGQNIGAGKIDRVRQGIRTGLFLTLSISIPFIGLVILFREPIYSLFTDSPEVIETGVMVMFYLAPFFLLHSITEVLSGAIRGAGNAMTPMMITLLTICVFRVVWILTMTRIWFDLRTVMASYPISWILCVVSFAIYFSRHGKLLMQPFK